MQSQVGLAERRSITHLAPIQTFSTAPSSTSSIGYDHSNAASPLPREPLKPISNLKVQARSGPPPKLGKKARVSSLFDLFSKPNVERAKGHHENHRFHEPKSPYKTPQSALSSRPLPRKVSQKKDDTPKHAMERRNTQGSEKSTAHSRPSTRGNDARLTAPWDPPPLFQAYPQAVIHTTLEVPSAPALVAPKIPPKVTKDAENVLEKKGRSLLGRLKTVRKSKSHNVIVNTPATQAGIAFVKKHIMLVTTGYLLQYPDHGPSERLPDKVLRLGPDSAAFASDLIPGKHWVLQVMSAANDDGSLVSNTQASLLTRIGLPATTGRKLVPTMLLVYDSAEEMERWMSVIRKEIQELGGRKADAGTIAKKPASTTEEDLLPRRFSSIKRPLSMMGDQGFTSTASSPTVVASNRASSTAVASLSNWSSTRSSTQPLPMRGFSDSRRLSAVSSKSGQQGQLSRRSSRVDLAAERTFLRSASSSISSTVWPNALDIGLPGLTPDAYTNQAQRYSPPKTSVGPDLEYFKKRMSLQPPSPRALSPTSSHKGSDESLGNLSNLSASSASSLRRLPSNGALRVETDVSQAWSLNGNTHSGMPRSPRSPHSPSLPPQQEARLSRAASSPHTQTFGMEAISETGPSASENEDATDETPMSEDTIATSPIAESSKESPVIRSSKTFRDGIYDARRVTLDATPSPPPATAPHRPSSSTLTSASTSGNSSRRTSTIISSAPIPLRSMTQPPTSRRQSQQSMDYAPSRTNLLAKTTATHSSSTTTQQPPQQQRRPISLQVRMNHAPFLANVQRNGTGGGNTTTGSNYSSPRGSIIMQATPRGSVIMQANDKRPGNRRVSTMVPIVRPATIKRRSEPVIIGVPPPAHPPTYGGAAGTAS